MLALNNDFLGYHPKIRNVSFTGSDTEELYQHNLKIQPNDWIYRSKEISYIYNDNGHRCKNISEIDLDNYILFTGCSHTEGIGLCLEDTYAYLMSQQMGCDYYNLSLGGTGLDVLSYNLVTWFSKVKKPPKLLVVQWPYGARLTLSDAIQSDPTPFYTQGIWGAKEYRELGDFLILGEQVNFFNTLNTLTRNIVKNIAPCPIIEVRTQNDTRTPVDVIIKFMDHARDMKGNDMISHMGIMSNKFTAWGILNKFTLMGI